MIILDGLMSLWIILGLVAFFGIIVFAVIIFKRHSNLFKKDEKPSDKEIVKQELDRVLEEVKDEESIKAMEDFEKNKAQNETDNKAE